MRQAFTQVRPGEPLDIHFREYNAFIDAAVADNQRISSGDRFDRADQAASLRVLINNDSGSEIEAGSIRKLGAPSYTSGDFLETFTFEHLAIDPASDRGFVVFPDDIPDGQYGWGVVAGVAYAPVSIGDESHDRCDVGTATQLASGFSGHARILHKPAGTGVLDCVILLEGIDQGEVKGVVDEDIQANASGLMSVWRNGADTDANVTAHLNWMHGGAQVSEGKQAIAR